MKEFPCSKLSGVYCTHCVILQKFQELLQAWRDKYTEMNSNINNEIEYEEVFPQFMKGRIRSNAFLRRSRSANYSFDSPNICEMKQNFPIEHTVESPSSINVLSKENNNDCEYRINLKSVEKSTNRNTSVRQHRIHSISSGFQDIMKRLQINNSKDEGIFNPNYDGAEISPQYESKDLFPKKKLPRMRSTDVIVQETEFVYKIPFKTIKSLEQLEPIKPALPPKGPSKSLKAKICATPLPFIPIGGYLDIRRNREMPPLSDLYEVTRVANIVVNKTKLGRRFIAKVQNEMFVYKAIHDLYVDFTLDLNCTHFCNSTDFYLILQNSVMCMTMTFYDKKTTEIWRSITSKNRTIHDGHYLSNLPNH